MRIYADYAIIGSTLKVKEKVYIEVAENGYIIKIGEHNGKYSYDYTFEESVIVPGFVNLHTHIGDSFAKELAYGLDVVSAVGSKDSLKWKLYESADYEEILIGMENAISEMLSSGTTTFVDFREGGIEGVALLKEATKKAKIKTIILGRGTDNDWEKVLKNSDGFGLPSLNRFSDDELKYLYKAAYLEGKYFSFHASETQEQRKKSIKKYGISDLLRGLDLTRPSFVIHATHANLLEIKKLAENRIPVVICPRSNFYLKAGEPPIKEFIENRVVLGLGTDNTMVSSPDIFQEIQFLANYALFHGLNLDPAYLLRLVTRNAARILNKPIGIIEEGFHADFFVFDLTKPNVAGIDDPIKAIVLRGKSENVIKTFVDGEVAFER